MTLFAPFLGPRRRLLRVWLLVVAVLGALVVPSSASETAVPRVDLPIEKYTLPNGLEVILARDPRVSTVSTNLWYHVGAADEAAGRTGFAHLFEHMMFEGSGHVTEAQLKGLTEGVGASLNASTDFDYTNYFLADLPSDQLELALWLESDRMGFLLDRLDRAGLANQQAVVRNERRQNWEQAPYAQTYEEVFRRLFPKEHPYHASVIGSHADIQAATLEDVRDFFKRYYVPNNATLAVAGNIDVPRTKAWIERYFGTIPRGAEPPDPVIEIPKVTAEQRVVLTDEVELPAVTMAWLTSPAFAPGDAEGDITAGILAGGESSRLYTALVRDKKIAQSVSAYQESSKHPSVFLIEAIAKPGRTAAELEAAIDAELAALRSSGPVARDLRAAKTRAVSDLVRGLESIGGFNGRADRLNRYNHYLGTPDHLNKDIARYDAVTGKDVAAFATEQLRRDGRVIIHTNPGERTLPPDPPAPPAPAAGGPPPPSAEPWRNTVPGAGPAPPVALPGVQRFALDNGMPVYLVESHGLPVVTASVVSRYGSAMDPKGRAGLAGFTAAMLRQGTKSRDADGIAREVADFGGLLESTADRDGSWVTVQALGPQAGRALTFAADLVRTPSFPKADIARVRDDLQVGLRQQADDPAATALARLLPAVYGDAHPYGHLPVGTRQGVAKVTRGDLVGFHARAFTPASTALVLAGDLTTEQARALATKAFGNWRGTSPEPPVPGLGVAAKERVVIVDTPGSAQTALQIGQPGLGRTHPDFERLQVANRVLGGLFSSRLMENLRETHGYTYGASSRLTSGRGAVPFHAYASVETKHTGASVREIFAELRRIRQTNMTDEELRRGKDSFVGSVPRLFQATPQAASTVRSIYLFGLGADYYKGLAARVAPFTAAELRAVAAKHLHPPTMKVIAVGDRATIAPQLEKLKLGKLVERKADGSLVRKKPG